ncbi:hypothetical protein GQ55_2G058100 [Panicum hallii var. hallii]|uniref:F-box protein AT5G49610-like beta-propeller domain-containing protein n=1 Tax=Panicum hallii var. hallii TaxID=1504633 RepID=A0A2T7ELV9_9POAL|nr:hypothetical protein GQ55_2G058100 [Panicum hallii var. hallii]
MRPRTRAARPPPELMDDIVEEILLRIPPADPASLVRAAASCKQWWRLVSGPGFRRRWFRGIHRAPLMLGAIRSILYNGRTNVSFVPAFPFLQPRAGRRGWRALDSRDGRVLLHREPRCLREKNVLAIWNPVTDEQRELPALPGFSGICAAVLCDASAAGDNLACSSGPFLVAFIGSGHEGTCIRVYSSESDAWGEPASAWYPGYLNKKVRGVCVGNAVYFALRAITRILEYDLGTGGVTVIDPPPMSSDLVALMTAEGGGLGCATEKGCRLQMWSREVGSDGLMGWWQRKAFRLRTMKPVGCDILKLHVVGFEDGGGIIYVGTDQGSFTTDLKSGRYLRKVEGVGGSEDILPYMTCYDPVPRVASTGEGPSSAVSSA